MKSILAILKRYLSAFLLAELLCMLYMGSLALIELGPQGLVPALASSSVAVVPLVVLIAGLLSFFSLNRLVSSRLSGYLLLVVLLSLSLAGPALAVRYVSSASLFRNGLPPAQGIDKVLVWYISCIDAPMSVLICSLAGYVVLLAGLWCFSRLSSRRPLAGAFLTPAACIGGFSLFSLLIDTPYDVAFGYFGVDALAPYGLGLSAVLIGLGCMFLDVLVGAKLRAESTAYE